MTRFYMTLYLIGGAYSAGSISTRPSTRYREREHGYHVHSTTRHTDGSMVLTLRRPGPVVPFFDTSRRIDVHLAPLMCDVPKFTPVLGDAVSWVFVE